MAEQEQSKVKAPRGAETAVPRESLPYHIELWDAPTSLKVERVLGRAYSAALARAIYMAAVIEKPGRRVTLRHGTRLIADSK